MGDIEIRGPSKEKEGAGVWWVLRNSALLKVPYFPQLVNDTVNTFFCASCKQEGRAFMTSNPIPRNANDWFPWVVSWQNAVNRRTGKRMISVPEALAIMEVGRTGQVRTLPSVTYVQNQQRQQSRPPQAPLQTLPANWAPSPIQIAGNYNIQPTGVLPAQGVKIIPCNGCSTSQSAYNSIGQ